MRENTDQKNSEYGHFSRGAPLYISAHHFALRGENNFGISFPVTMILARL